MARLRLAGFWLTLTLGAQEPPGSSATQQPAKPESTAEDPGRPVLKRGGPAQKREEVAPPPARPAYREVTVDADGRTEAVNTSEPARLRKGTDELIERAREAAAEFDGKLPSFICDQLTSRFESRTLKPDWKYKDRIQVELVYTGGKEDYRNIRINNKPIKKGSPEDSGTWSTGEFGTVQMDIYHPSTSAYFTLRGDSSAAGMTAKVYDYTVREENSHWTIRIGHAVKPAYKGAVWIDPNSARTLRIEMSTRSLPVNYEVDTVETVVDYGWITLSGQKFLLPTRSEGLSCQRGTFNCTKNVTEFRNYRKFQVESQVLQVESEISFPEAEAPKPPAPVTKKQ